jgi:integrase/recombinase XerC
MASFLDHFDAFAHYLRFEKRYSPHTILAYKGDLDQFAHYLNETYGASETAALSADAITHIHIRSWLAKLKEDGQQERSINRKISSLSGYCKYLMRQGLLQRNPVRMLHNMRLSERLPVFLKEQETEFLMEEISFGEGFKGFTDRLILELLYLTGMRRSELTGLKDKDIEWSLRQLRVLGKGHKERLLPIGEGMLEQLREYIAAKKQAGLQGEYLLVLQDGNKLYDVYVYRVVKHYLSQVTSLKKKSPHILRHTFATHLLHHGAGIQAIKDLLGHASIAATQIYTHINIEELKKVHKLNHPRG